MIEELVQQLLDREENRYYGKYRGYVHAVDDPLDLGRIRAMVPRLLEEVPTGWAMPCVPYAGPDQGFYTVPDVGTGVWIEFEEGDLSRPIWSGMWWGAPSEADVGQDDSTAREHRTDPETPEHNLPRETAEPGVRMLKSSTGHHIVLDDRPGSERIEIHDSVGNRLILTHEGFDRLIYNERTVNEGNRSAQIDGHDTTVVAMGQTETIGAAHVKTVAGDSQHTVAGSLTERAFANLYTRKVDATGLSVEVKGNRVDTVTGSHLRTVVGRSQEVAVGGYGVAAGGPVNIGSATSMSFGSALPAVPPSLNAVGMDALMGNITINTKLGICQIGGPLALSPVVLGDGLMAHLAALVGILKTINPPAAPGYGAALDAWLATAPLLILSQFAFVKRMPFG